VYYGHKVKSQEFPDVIGMLGSHFSIDVEPLEKIFAPNDKGDEEAWESAAQPPSELLDCLKALVQALANNPNVFTGMEVVPQLGYLEPQELFEFRDYFLKGNFLQDLVDLLKMVEWAQENGENQVRLYYG
jgi:hypothetical protein